MVARKSKLARFTFFEWPDDFQHPNSRFGRNDKQNDPEKYQKSVVTPADGLVVAQSQPHPELVQSQTQAEAVKKGNEILGFRFLEKQGQIPGSGQDKEPISEMVDMDLSQCPKKIWVNIIYQAGNPESQKEGDRNREEQIKIKPRFLGLDVADYRPLVGYFRKEFKKH